MDIDGVSLKVTNVFKRYGENSVINGLNMYVSSGYIYGLLGPSGCGKSTLLQCILGTIPLDSGCIDLRATYLKDVGYMPQEISLDERLTVKEIFEFYGTLYKMKNEEINFRINELKFLQLPNMNSYIKNLSGGESRRVSFALCILHNPKIIILDEPTIGVDPVLRQEIWQEFKNMTKLQSKTIIITTHYIEEANLADCIGFMRKGVLVDEGSPQHILTKYNTESLEESFLIACHNQEINHIADHNKIQVQTKTPTNKRIKFKNNFSFYRVKALLKKNYRVYFRDYILLYTMIILPILQSIIYCSSIGLNFKNMLITVKNDEVNVSDCQSFNINGCVIDENKNQTMSCVILNYLKSLDYSYTFIEVQDHKAGEMSLNLPNHMAFLYFPKNFTEELTTYIVDPENYANLTYALLTKENFMFRNQIQMDVRNSILHLVEKTLTSCSKNPKTVSIPMEFNIVYGHEVKSYANGTITVFLALLAFYFSSTFSSSIIMEEKMDGTLNRSMFAGIKVFELVLSMFCINTIIVLIQMFFTCFVSFVLFSNPIQITNGLFVYMLLMLQISWNGFFCGLIGGVLSPTKICGVYMITAMLLTQFFLSGAIWPIEGQPYLLNILSEVLPIRLVGNAMNNIALKGWTLNHPLIIKGTTLSFVYNVLLVLVLIILGKFKKDLWVQYKQ